MKPKISPTSPKINKEKQKGLDEYYQQSLKTIEKPSRSRIGSRLGFIFLVIIFGFLSGTLGLIMLLSYGSEIPWVGNLGIFSSSTQSSFFITGSSNNKILTTEQVDKIIEEINPTVVQIYQEKELASDLESLYLPGEAIANGLVLTDDGFIVTLSQSIIDNAEKLVVITHDGNIYKVDSVIKDPATSFIFLKIKATNLPTITLGEDAYLHYLEDIILLKRYAFNGRPEVIKASLLDSNYKKLNSIDDFIYSSESYKEVMRLGENVSRSMNQSVVFSFNREALGIVEENNGDYTILPFSQIKHVIYQLLSDQPITRPYLGIHYIDLYEVINLSQDLTLGLKKGVIIYTDDETQRPSIKDNSPAHKAGLISGDIITCIDGQIINGRMNFSEVILSYKPGQIITLDIQRADEVKEIKITLDELE
jgi:S1-C subfamily serine protease